jgi:hypothetical protein
MLQAGKVEPRQPLATVGSGPTLVVSNDNLRSPRTSGTTDTGARAG